MNSPTGFTNWNWRRKGDFSFLIWPDFRFGSRALSVMSRQKLILPNSTRPSAVMRCPPEWSGSRSIGLKSSCRRVRDRLVQPLPPPSLDRVAALSFRNALNLSGEHEYNSSEEFWQNLFTEQPQVIAQAVPTSIVFAKAQCLLDIVE